MAIRPRRPDSGRRRAGAPRGFRPRRARGQNLLIDQEIVERIVTVAGIDSTSNVLEIGAGSGVLTRALAARAGQVLAIEVEAELTIRLRQELKGYDNLKVIRGDARTVDLATFFPGRQYKLVANLPYSVGTPLLVDVLRADHRPDQITVMLQREVAERICALPGDWSTLTVMTRPFGDPHIAFGVPPSAFWPKPKVFSAVVSITTNDRDRSDPATAIAIFLARHAFAQRRKKMANSLAAGLHLERPPILELLSAAGLDPDGRPADLDMDQWFRLAETFRAQESLPHGLA